MIDESTPLWIANQAAVVREVHEQHQRRVASGWHYRRKADGSREFVPRRGLALLLWRWRNRRC